MTREELLSKNRATVREVSRNLKMRATGAVIVVVTNPLDAMSYEVYRATGFEKEKVMGMAGELDAARFIQLVADELKVPRSSVKTYVLGSHAETMVPIISKTLVSGRPLTELLSAEKIERMVSRVRDRGAEIVSLLGTGSAYYSPSAAVFKMVRAVLNDTKETVVVSAYLDGEYGLKGLFMGVPCRLGRRGIEEVLTLEMSDAEKEALARSSQAIKSSIESS
jgi:malate dehydrogenase